MLEFGGSANEFPAENALRHHDERGWIRNAPAPTSWSGKCAARNRRARWSRACDPELARVQRTAILSATSDANPYVWELESPVEAPTPYALLSYRSAPDQNTCDL